ncbi:uncharacterized protein TNCV_2243411 [Trichonephila clavipes]|nr:uncharacterized protein TNCV_2243411 [Trichonephila clavipes]
MRGHDNLVVKVMDLWLAFHEFDPVLLKTRRVGQRCMLNLSKLKRPPVGVVWKLREGGTNSGVVLVDMVQNNEVTTNSSCVALLCDDNSVCFIQMGCILAAKPFADTTNPREYARPNTNPSGSEAKATTSNEQNRNTISPRTVNNNDISAHAANPLKLPPADVPPRLPSTSPPKLPVRSSSLEDVRDRISEGKASLLELKDKSHRRRRRTTLPKRRFSDLHLHILLCPKSPLCGDGSSSDDVPLTASSQRAHRSLPDSPSELDEVSSFCFDFLEKGSKEKALSSSRSIFYVSVDANEQTKVSETIGSSSHMNSNSKLEPQTSPVVSPSIEKNRNPSTENEDSTDNCDLDENLSPDQYDTDEDILENDYENLDPIYEELSDVSNSSKRIDVTGIEPEVIFEGASKIDILSYLEDAKERGISEGLSEDEKVIIEEEDEEHKVLSGEEEDGGGKSNGWQRRGGENHGRLDPRFFFFHTSCNFNVHETQYKLGYMNCNPHKST